MKDSTPVVYLLGAGRSGTTLMATVLDGVSWIDTLGEMHHFPAYAKDNNYCACGKRLESCPFWSKVLARMGEPASYYHTIKGFCDRMEGHRRIPRLLISPMQTKYLQIQERIFSCCAESTAGDVLLDASKYIARYLMLRQSSHLRLRGVYVVRDVRGVVESFNKKVQTRKRPLAAILYYLLINFFGELTFRLCKDVIKIRYEDFISQPEATVARILDHVAPEKEKPGTFPGQFQIPHIVGGNRMKSNGAIRIDPSIGWRARMSRGMQIFYYFAAMPTMLLNRYKI